MCQQDSMVINSVIHVWMPSISRKTFLCGWSNFNIFVINDDFSTLTRNILLTVNLNEILAQTRRPVIFFLRGEGVRQTWLTSHTWRNLQQFNRTNELHNPFTCDRAVRLLGYNYLRLYPRICWLKRKMYSYFSILRSSLLGLMAK